MWTYACGRRITAIMAAFQAADAGSTPAARTPTQTKTASYGGFCISERKDALFNRVFKCLCCAELRYLHCGYGQSFTGARITSLARCTGLD